MEVLKSTHKNVQIEELAMNDNDYLEEDTNFLEMDHLEKNMRCL